LHKPSHEPKIASRSKTFGTTTIYDSEAKADRLRSPTLVNNTTTIATMSSTQSVACFGKKRTATAVAIAKNGKGLSTFSQLELKTTLATARR
jgi:hypothetical protein